MQLQTRLNRLEDTLSNSRKVRRALFEPLKSFFPEMDDRRLETVEEFHDGISKILRNELTRARLETKSKIDLIESDLRLISGEIANALSNVDNPSYVVDRVMSVTRDVMEREEQNREYEERERHNANTREAEQGLRIARGDVTESAERIINAELKKLTATVQRKGSPVPRLALAPRKYSYEVEMDKGTGTAYLALALLDLVMLRVSQLPIIVHDSLMFKNVEPESFNQLVGEYKKESKQIFISIDETQKYSSPTQAILLSKRVVDLSRDKVLFTKNWRQQKATEGA